MKNKYTPIILLAIITVSLFISACGSRATQTQTIVQTVVVKEKGEAVVAEVAATVAPAITAVPAEPGVSQRTDGSAAPYRISRMIIKNGEMNLLVDNTDTAIDRVTGVVIDVGGYIVSNKTWLTDGYKYATITMGVPVDQFEVAQRRLRALAIQVLNDAASGQDVSDEYVDLQSRLTNLEATAARIRDFLKDAKNVEEALKVNAKLAEVEAEIEQVKGRMNYLKDRAAFSTITVNLEPQRPTPIPTLTPTPTPIPTPVRWQPGKTFQAASGTLVVLTQNLIDMLIWLVVVVGPCAVPIIAGIIFVARLRRSARSRLSPKSYAQPAPVPNNQAASSQPPADQAG